MSKHTVIVYSTKTCPYCVQVKKYLGEKKVDFREIDVGSSRAEAAGMLLKSGQTGVPVIEIDGKMIIGFDRAAIDKALK